MADKINVKIALNKLADGFSTVSDEELQSYYKVLAKAANMRIKRMKEKGYGDNPILNELPENIRNSGFSLRKTTPINLINKLPLIINFIKNPITTVRGYERALKDFEDILKKGTVKGEGFTFVFPDTANDGRMKSIHSSELVKPATKDELNTLYDAYDRFMEISEYSSALGRYGSTRLINELHNIRIQKSNTTEEVKDSYGTPLEPFTVDWYVEKLAQELGLKDGRKDDRQPKDQNFFTVPNKHTRR